MEDIDDLLEEFEIKYIKPSDAGSSSVIKASTSLDIDELLDLDIGEPHSVANKNAEGRIKCNPPFVGGATVPRGRTKQGHTRSDWSCQLRSRGTYLLFQTIRGLSSTEVSTALRPFYFSVHPDLFGQFPEERGVNENSLKLLSSYLEGVQQQKSSSPVTLKFYLRPQGHTSRLQTTKSLQCVDIKLNERNVKKVVLSILKTCNLPTTYVDKINPQGDRTVRTFTEEDTIRFYENLSRKEAEFYENDPIIGATIRRIKKSKETKHLKVWLEQNFIAAQDSLLACEPIRNEIERLKLGLCAALELKIIKWDCGWNISHFRGCLQSFQDLSKHHPEIMASLKGKTLIFGTDTGVNLDGDVMLNSGEVRHNWLEVIRNIHREDKVLLKLPAFERAVSRVLRDIRVVHRKFQPKVMAKQYEGQLRRLTTSLSDYQGRLGYPKHWPSKLDNFQLVVETEAGPLMLSPTGQFIVPSSCPAFLIVHFFSEHMDEAQRLLEEYKGTKYVERDLHRRVLGEFNLASLRKDDNITPSLMIACCQQLILHKPALLTLLNNSSLFVTTYYSLLSDAPPERLRDYGLCGHGHVIHG